MAFGKCGSMLVSKLLKKSMSGNERLVSHGLGSQTRLSSSYGSRVPFKEPTLSELPVPEGSWQSHYSKQNGKATRHLIGGIGFYLFTLSVLYGSGLVAFNSSIPTLSDDFKAAGNCVPPPPKC